MACTLLGELRVTGGADEGGHRTYKLTYLVESGPNDGPANVMNCPGIPLPGTYWIIGDDVDLWAWCRFERDVQHYAHKDGEYPRYWALTMTFSTKPLAGGPWGMARCTDSPVEDPLLEPARISGGFKHYTEEAWADRHGNRILTSSWENITGPQVEVEKGRPTVRIQLNVATFDLAGTSAMVHTVNSSELWGMPPRTVKFSNFTWEEQYHGICSKYYTLTFEFEADYRGFDRDLPDEGSKTLSGSYLTSPGSSNGATYVLKTINGLSPDKNNPQHFIRYQDRNGNPSKVMLDGNGQPAYAGRGVSIASISDAGTSVVTVETATAHGLTAGSSFNIVGASPKYYNGSGTVISAPTATSFTYDTGIDVSVLTSSVPNQGYLYARGRAPGVVHTEHYNESDFLTLGIPALL